MKKIYLFLVLASCYVNINAQNYEGDTLSFESKTDRYGNSIISNNLKPTFAGRG